MCRDEEDIKKHYNVTLRYVCYCSGQSSDLINCICRLWFCLISHASTLGKIPNGIYPVSCYSWESVVDYSKNEVGALMLIEFPDGRYCM